MRTLTELKTHEQKIVGSGMGCRAECACGWVGQRHTWRFYAEIEMRTHILTVREIARRQGVAYFEFCKLSCRP